MSVNGQEEVIELAGLLCVPSADQWLPKVFEPFERAVGDFIRRSSKREVATLVARIEDMAKRGETTEALAMLPIVIGCSEKFGKSPELMVEAYILCEAVGGKYLSMASGFLREAHALDAGNCHVLWQLWASYRIPDFPVELRRARTDLEHERNCLQLILANCPEGDRVQALRVLEWINRTNRPYARSTDVPAPVWSIELSTRPSATKRFHELIEDL